MKLIAHSTLQRSVPDSDSGEGIVGPEVNPEAHADFFAVISHIVVRLIVVPIFMGLMLPRDII